MANTQRRKLQIVLVLIIAIAGFFAYRYYEKTMDTATLTPAEYQEKHTK
jgi:predicted negative regulator of RcsB-dependent stress response